MKKLPLIPTLLVGLVMGSSAVQAELPRYEVINLESWWGPRPPDTTQDIYAFALNNAGEVLTQVPVIPRHSNAGIRAWQDGVAVGAAPPALPQDYQVRYLKYKGFTNEGNYALDLVKPDPDNPFSVALADFKIAVSNLHTGVTTVIPDIPGAVMNSSAPTLSNGGQYLISGSDGETLAWRYSSATNSWQNVPGPGFYNNPYGVNDLGQVVGRMANAAGNTVPFTYTDSGGTRTFTDGQGNALFGEANAVNNSGLVTGTANGRAYVFNSSTLEFKYVSPVSDQQVMDINEEGSVIGYFRNPNLLGTIPGNLAWISIHNESFVPLNDLIGQDLENSEWRINEVYDINDEGYILGLAYNFREFKSYQVLLRPVPEPGTAIFCATAGLAVFLRRRRLQ
jgi:hypothetical protein